VTLIGPLTCVHDVHWALLPKFLARVERFCATYPTDLLSEVLREFVIANFRLPAATVMGAWVVLDASERVVGHALTSIEPRGRERVGFLVQYECDRPIPDTLRQEMMASFRKWAAGNGVQTLEAISWLPLKVLARYGFAPHRVIVRAPVEVAE
jgi:hypothetical protein